MNPLTQSKNATVLPVLIALTLGCLGLSPQARAVDPPPDGGYPGRNTAEGDDALLALTKGTYNTAVGFKALSSITTGYYNTAIGGDALRNSERGVDNTAIGYAAMVSNEGGSNNTAIGQIALYSNTDGGGNTAIGTGAMYSNTNGISNTATGFEALFGNTEGQYNTATGSGALLNSTGNFNTASGASALVLNTTGGNNTALGASALASNTTGNYNIAVGPSAGRNLTTGSKNIAIGNVGVAGEANTIRIGVQGTQTATFIAGISGTPLGPGVAVGVNVNGQLGVRPSSARYKEAIQPMDKASEAILALQPVTFRYKHELDPDGIPQFGLVAEDVEKVNPDLVARDGEGKPYTVRYEAVNAMLLNEFLKEHRRVQTLEASLAQVETDSRARAAKQQCEIDSLTAALKHRQRKSRR